MKNRRDYAVEIFRDYISNPVPDFYYTKSTSDRSEIFITQRLKIVVTEGRPPHVCRCATRIMRSPRVYIAPLSRTMRVLKAPVLSTSESPRAIRSSRRRRRRRVAQGRFPHFVERRTNRGEQIVPLCVCASYVFIYSVCRLVRDE